MDTTLHGSRPGADAPILYLAWLDLGLPDDFADLDVDGIFDVIFVAPELSADNQWFASAKALSGRDGHLLWQTRFKFPGTTSARNLPLIVRDLDCDGNAEIVIQDIPDLRLPNPTISVPGSGAIRASDFTGHLVPPAPPSSFRLVKPRVQSLHNRALSLPASRSFRPRRPKQFCSMPPEERFVVFPTAICRRSIWAMKAIQRWS